MFYIMCVAINKHSMNIVDSTYPTGKVVLFCNKASLQGIYGGIDITVIQCCQNIIHTVVKYVIVVILAWPQGS